MRGNQQYLGFAPRVPYGGVSDLIVDGNQFTNLNCAVGNFSLGQRNEPAGNLPATHMDPNLFHLIENNTITGCRLAVEESSGGLSGTGIQATYGFAHVYRNNTVSNNTLAGFYSLMGTQQSGIPALDMVLFDDGNITGCPAGPWLQNDPPTYPANLMGTIIFTDDSFTFGGAVNPGSNLPFGIAMDGTDTTNLELNNNTYVGWGASNYGATMVPGPVLEVPWRTFTEAAYVSGSSVSDSVQIWDDGTASLGCDGAFQRGLAHAFIHQRNSPEREHHGGRHLDLQSHGPEQRYLHRNNHRYRDQLPNNGWDSYLRCECAGYFRGMGIPLLWVKPSAKRSGGHSRSRQ